MVLKDLLKEHFTKEAKKETLLCLKEKNVDRQFDLAICLSKKIEEAYHCLSHE